MKFKGKGRQRFSITIDLDKLAKMMMQNITQAINEENDLINPEITDYEFDVDNVRLDGTYDFEYSGEWHRATRECPEEYDIDRPYILGFWGYDDKDFEQEKKDTNDWLLKHIPAEMRSLIKISNITEDEDDWDAIGG